VFIYINTLELAVCSSAWDHSFDSSNFEGKAFHIYNYYSRYGFRF